MRLWVRIPPKLVPCFLENKLVKYMKTKNILIALSLLLLGSCTNDFEYIPSQEVKEKTFVSDFNNAFGVSEETYSTHNWGMDLIPLVDVTPVLKTRSANVNGNMWYQTWVRPTNITTEEIAWAKEEFGKVRKDTKPWVSIEWSNYWVQQVYKGTTHYVDGYGSDVLGSNQMYHLKVFNNKKVEVICWWPYEEDIVTYAGDYEHINNFNNGNNETVYTDDETHEQFIGTTLMQNMGTDGRAEQFTYYNSSDSKYHYEYIVLEHNGSYFIGFDFYAHGTDVYPNNKNMDVERDWIYDDWIIKITPATSINDAHEVERVRVMCEDLGSSHSDFDYNDVVFDIKFIKNGNQYTADIVLRACGGTLPLIIGNKEVHDEFGVARNTMYNTEVGHDVNIGKNITVTLQGSDYETAIDAINDLPVVVIMSGKKPIQLTVGVGKPAEMIVVPITTDWSDERVSIKNRYPKFVDWVEDPTIIWYE